MMSLTKWRGISKGKSFLCKVAANTLMLIVAAYSSIVVYIAKRAFGAGAGSGEAPRSSKSELSWRWAGGLPGRGPRLASGC
jgi:hypothetical protein